MCVILNHKKTIALLSVEIDAVTNCGQKKISAQYVLNFKRKMLTERMTRMMNGSHFQAIRKDENEKHKSNL